MLGSLCPESHHSCLHPLNTQQSHQSPSNTSALCSYNGILAQVLIAGYHSLKNYKNTFVSISGRFPHSSAVTALDLLRCRKDSQTLIGSQACHNPARSCFAISTHAHTSKQKAGEFMSKHAVVCASFHGWATVPTVSINDRQHDPCVSSLRMNHEGVFSCALSCGHGHISRCPPEFLQGLSDTMHAEVMLSWALAS